MALPGPLREPRDRGLMAAVGEIGAQGARHVLVDIDPGCERDRT